MYRGSLKRLQGRPCDYILCFIPQFSLYSVLGHAWWPLYSLFYFLKLG